MRLNVPCLRIRSGAAGLLIASLLLAACSSSTSPTPTAAPELTPTPNIPEAEATSFNTTVTRNIVYATVGEVSTELDVYAPTNPGSWPVVIIIHNSGLNRRNFSDLSDAFASHGAIVYNIDVVFSVPFINDIQREACAVRLARATAADYGGDPSRIILVGSSGGANTGAVVALAGDDFAEDCVVTDASALPYAFVGFEGSYGYDKSGDWGKYDHTFLRDEDPELWDAINPYSHIGGNPGLKVLLIHGNDEDRAWYDVPIETSVQFYQALADTGYDVEFMVLEGASHTTLTSKYLFPDSFALTVEKVMELARAPSQ